MEQKTIVQTLTFVSDGSKMLLGLNKGGFGEGKWDGFGGDLQDNENITDCAKRELTRGCGIVAQSIEFKGLLLVTFHHNNTIRHVHIFEVSQWEGSITESESMKPQWFENNQIPYENMWANDIYWHPLFIKGNYFWGNITFIDPSQMSDYKFNEVSKEALLEIQKENVQNQLN